MAIAGPGIITSNVDNDAGGITTYSLAGSEFGFKLLWSLLPITIILVVVQDLSARMGTVTGKGLAALIRERFGAGITFYLMIGLVFTNLGNTIAEFAGVAASMQIFGIKPVISVPLSAILVWFLVLKASYKVVEKVFLWACLFYISYIISGIMVEPDWGATVKTIIDPDNFDLSYEATIMVVALVGTTIAPWMQFYLQASIVDKGLTYNNYRLVRWDVIIGSVCVAVVAFFIILVCAITMYPHGIIIEDASQAALALAPVAGYYASTLFAFGLLNASLFAACILPLSTAYTVCEALGWEASVDLRFSEAPQFYVLYAMMIILGAGIIMIPNLPLIPIMYFSQVLNGLVLPVVLCFMVLLVTDEQLMREARLGRLGMIFNWGVVVILSLLSVYLAWVSIF
ncbi:MAG: Nramp family divalent metal transporter [Desulfarculales bacterium]|nr:Nramp family divalent metal transporter [Desulfarculales bacterium]